MAVQLTPREQELLVLGFKCADTAPKINFQKLAQLAKLKNASTASVMYNNAKRKLTRAFEDPDKSTTAETATDTVAADATTPTPTKPKGRPKGATSASNARTGRKRKASAIDASPGTENLGIEPSPVKGEPGEYLDYPDPKRHKLVPCPDAGEADDVGDASMTGVIKKEETHTTIKNEGEGAMTIAAIPTAAATSVKGKAITKPRAAAKPRAPRVKKGAAESRSAMSKPRSETPPATTATQSASGSAQTSPGRPPFGELTIAPDEEMAAAYDAYHNNYPVLPEVAGTTGMRFEEHLMSMEEIARAAEHMS